MKVSVKVQHLGQIVFRRRADNGFGHGLTPGIMALQGYYQKPSIGKERKQAGAAIAPAANLPP